MPMNHNKNNRSFNRKKKNRVIKNFLQENPEYNLLYHQLLKEARVWNSISQYWLANEATRRANCLLKGDIDGYKQVKHSNELYFHKY